MKNMVLARVLTVALVGALILGAAVPANAVTVRTGWRWNQVDVLLTRDETSSAASGLAGSAVVCRSVIASATGAALAHTRHWVPAAAAAFASSGICMPAVSASAARAYQQGRRAGMTISLPNFWNYWSWSY